MIFIGFIIVGLWLAINCITAKVMDAKEMQAKFLDGQNIVGKIATNIFYAPAWLLKFIKVTIIKTVK